jgi:hypothetical protein
VNGGACVVDATGEPCAVPLAADGRPLLGRPGLVNGDGRTAPIGPPCAVPPRAEGCDFGGWCGAVNGDGSGWRGDPPVIPCECPGLAAEHPRTG